MGEVLVFDIYGQYAHFKKYYTTSSPLTYSIPPRTAITGILGAILGIEKGDNNEVFNYKNCNIALSVLFPIKKTFINFNYINTKVLEDSFRMYKKKSSRSQIRIEFIKSPKYRIYVEIFNKDMQEKLKKYLANHISYYSISLGLSENLSTYTYIGTFNYDKLMGTTYINSVLNLKDINSDNIVLENNKQYFYDRVALEMLRDREIIEYGDILFEKNAKTIKVSDCEYYLVGNGDRIIWY